MNGVFQRPLGLKYNARVIKSNFRNHLNMFNIRAHLRLALKFARATINAVFYSEKDRQGIILINQCAVLK